MSLEKHPKREPMKKDMCCINIATVENYIRSILSEVPYDQLLEGIVGNDEFLVTDETSEKIGPVNKNYLLDSNNWISNKLWDRIIFIR